MANSDNAVDGTPTLSFTDQTPTPGGPTGSGDRSKASLRRPLFISTLRSRNLTSTLDSEKTYWVKSNFPGPSNTNAQLEPMTETPPTYTADNLAEWVDTYGNYLFRFALTRVQSSNVAEDLVQETFLAALKGLPSFQGRSSPKTWLTAILKHKTIDYFRKSSRETTSDQLETRSSENDALFDETGHWSVAPKRWSTHPDRIFEQKEFMGTLRDCMDRLPPRMARTFAMRELEGMSTRQICDILDITESNCWVILYRARMGLRKCLEENWIEPAAEDASEAPPRDN